MKAILGAILLVGWWSLAFSQDEVHMDTAGAVCKAARMGIIYQEYSATAYGPTYDIAATLASHKVLDRCYEGGGNINDPGRYQPGYRGCYFLRCMPAD